MVDTGDFQRFAGSTERAPDARLTLVLKSGRASQLISLGARAQSCICWTSDPSCCRPAGRTIFRFAGKFWSSLYFYSFPSSTSPVRLITWQPPPPPQPLGWPQLPLPWPSPAGPQPQQLAASPAGPQPQQLAAGPAYRHIEQVLVDIHAPCGQVCGVAARNHDWAQPGVRGMRASRRARWWLEGGEPRMQFGDSNVAR